MTAPFAAERILLRDVELLNATDYPNISGLVAPVGSRQYGPGATQWLKQGSADLAWRNLLVHGQYFNILDYGAVGDGVTDNRVAINAAITAARAAGGGVVYVPPGDFVVYKVGAGQNFSFDLNGPTYSNIMFLGCGAASLIHATGNGYAGDWFIFNVRAGCKYVTFKNLAFSGAGITNPDPAEQMHAINVTNLATDNDYTGHVRILDCRFFYMPGDGVRALGNSDIRTVRDVLIKRGVVTMRLPSTLMLAVPATPSAYTIGNWPVDDFNSGEYTWTITYANASGSYGGTHGIFTQALGGLWIKAAALELYTSPGNVLAFSLPHTWAAGQTVTYTLNTRNKKVTIAGATTGNTVAQPFTQVGPYWDTAVSGGNLYVGDFNGINPINGTISDLTLRGVGSRSGIGYQRATFGINTIDCYMTGADDQEIDMESTATASMGEHVIVGNHFDHDGPSSFSMTLSGTGVGRHSCSVIELNAAIGGAVQGLDVQNTIVASNLVVWTGHPFDGDPAMKFQERIDGLAILGNQIYVESDMTTGNICLDMVEGSGGSNHRSTVAGNIFVRRAIAAKVTDFETQNELLFANNYVRLDADASPSLTVMRTVGTVGRAVVVAGCMFRAIGTAAVEAVTINASTANTTSILCADTICRNTSSAGIQLAASGGGVRVGPAIGHGIIATLSGAQAFSPGTLYSPVEGNGGVAPRGLIELGAAPGGATTGAPGSMGLRSTGAGDGLTVYLKEDAATGTAGWVNKGPAEIVFAANDLTVVATALHLGPGGGLPVADATELSFVAPFTGIMRNLRIKQTAGTGAGNTTYTVRRNAADTGLAATLAFTGTTATNATQIAVTAGQRLSLRITKSAAPATAPTFAQATFELYPKS